MDGTESAHESVDIDTKIEGNNEFLNQIPESYRDRDYLKGIDSMDKFVEQFDNAQKLIGKKTVGVPSDESSIEEWQEFYNKMGRPESPDAYEFDLVELPDGYKRGDEELAMMKQIFHEAGLTAKQANTILKKTDEAVLKYYNDNKENMEKMVEERDKAFLAEMDKYLGSERDQALATAETMLKKYVPQGMEEIVKGLGDKEMLVLSTVLHNVHKAGRTEDGMKKDVQPVPDQSPESLRETARKLMQSPEWTDEFHPNHDAMVKRVKALYQKMAGA